MSNESAADVYASFGVNSAVVTSGNQEEHEQNMLELDVSARDGDDSIELSQSEDTDIYATNDPFADPEEDDGTRNSLRISTEDGGEETDSGDTEGSSETNEEFTPLGDAPKEVTELTAQLDSHEQGFQEMINQASERGLPEEAIAQVQTEYAEDGELSEGSYKALADAGYSKAFVDSYIAGQVALVNSYVAGIKEYAGGDAKFQELYSHLETSNPEAAESLIAAIESRDMGTVKAIINLAGQSRVKSFGKPAARSLTKKGTQAVATRQVVGFESPEDMMKAMSDPRYRSNAKFRAEVEQKVYNSKF